MDLFPALDFLIHPVARASSKEVVRHGGFLVAHLAAGVAMCFGALLGGLAVWIGAALFVLALFPALVLRLSGQLLVRFTLAAGLSLALMTLALSLGVLLTGGSSSPFFALLILPLMVSPIYGERRLVLLAFLLCAMGAALVFGVQHLAFFKSDSDSFWTSPQFSFIVFALVLGSTGLVILAKLFFGSKETADLVEHEEQFRFLAENSADTLIRHGPGGCIAYISPACSTLLGYGPEYFAGKALNAFVHCDDRQEVENAFTRASYFGGDCAVEYRMRHADGHNIWVETICRPVFALAASRLSPTPKSLPAPHCFEVISVTRDISAHKSYELELLDALDHAEAANQAKSRFLANMSHELRTPLNAIIGFSEMITTQTFGVIGSPKYAEYAELIHRSGHHLLTLINDILDLAKIEAGKFQLLVSNVNIPKLIEETANLVTVTAERAAVSIDFVLEEGLPPCRGDERALKQILLNLVSNALKFTPAGGQVAISASVRNAHLCLQVVDTGEGIAPEDLKRLGAPFEQVKNQVTKNKVGTGLGLSLVKSLAALHGGSVEMTSIVGEGTCVTVRIPLEETASKGVDLSVVVNNDATDDGADAIMETLKGAA